MRKYWLAITNWSGIDLTFLMKGSFWINLEKVWRIFGDLGIIILLTRLTSLKVVGQFELLISVYSLVSILAITGFNSSLLRALSKGYDGTFKEVMRLSWRWSLVGTIGLFLGGWWCIYTEFHAIGTALLVTAPIFPLYTVLRRWDVVLQAKEKFKERSTYYAISSIVLLLSVGSAIWWFRINIVIPFFILILTQSLLNILFYRRVKRLLVNNQVETGWMKSGYKLFLSEIFHVLYSRLDRLIIVSWLGVEVLAIYAIATKIGEGMKLVIGGIVSVYVPRLYKHGTIMIVRWYQTQGLKLTLLIALGLLGLWLVTPTIINVLFGNQYRSAGLYGQWYLLIIPFHFIASIWGYLLIKEKRELLFVSCGVLAGISNIVAYIILIPKWGISGAVAGSIVYYVILSTVYVGSVHWLLGNRSLRSTLEP